MTTKADPPASDRAERERRLAQALRDNLRRRKDQARARGEEADPAPEDGDNPAGGKRSG